MLNVPWLIGVVENEIWTLRVWTMISFLRIQCTSIPPGLRERKVVAHRSRMRVLILWIVAFRNRLWYARRFSANAPLITHLLKYLTRVWHALFDSKMRWGLLYRAKLVGTSAVCTKVCNSCAFNYKREVLFYWHGREEHSCLIISLFLTMLILRWDYIQRRTTINYLHQDIWYSSKRNTYSSQSLFYLTGAKNLG